MRRFLRAIVAVGAVAFCAGAIGQVPDAAITPDPATTPAEEDYVVIWRRVPNDFRSASLSLSDSQQLVERSPLRTIALAQGDTLSGRLEKEFRVTAAVAPALYGEMVDRIVRVNALSSADKVLAGEVLAIPAIPRADHVVGSELQSFKVLASEAPRYVLDFALEQGASGRIDVTFDEGGSGAALVGNAVLGAEMADRIRNALGADENGIRPVLVVLDDSIPDRAEDSRTREFVLHLSSVIRDAHALGPSPHAADITALASDFPGAQAHLLHPNLTMHASRIKQALQPFMALDPEGRIRVVYFPLAASQMGVSPLFEEVLYLAELLKLTASSGHDRRPVLQSLRDEAARRAEMVLDSRPSVFKAALVDFATGKVQSDRSLVEALSIVLDAYSTATGHPHALSLSWTVPKLQVPAYLAENPYGWKVAAVGKPADGRSDFIERELMYASRAVGPQDVVAVLNSDSDESGCASNGFDDSTGVQVLGLAYTGRIDSGRCGTSFSTPRVAWLLAAREAALGEGGQPPLTPYFKTVWNQKQKHLVLNARSSAPSPVFRKYGLRIEGLFGAVTP